MITSLRIAILLGVVMVAFGCSATKTATFNVTVENRADTPLMVFLTKDGPPNEKGWMGPEQLVTLRKADDDSIAGAYEIPAGKTLFMPKDVQGSFAPQTSPLLRIYRGRFKGLAELLAISSSSPDFLEFQLPPGKSHWIISITPDGRLSHKGSWEQKR